MSGWEIVHAIHDVHWTAYLKRTTDGRVWGGMAGHTQADETAASCGQRIIRHGDGTCTIEDLPQPKTALKLVEELRADLRRWQVPSLEARGRLDAIAEAIREGRAS